MAYPQKIATCCYCGTRAALVLKGRTQHELSCSSCGAPLHNLKMLPKKRTGDREHVDRYTPRRSPSAKPSSRGPSAKPSKRVKSRRKGSKIFRKIFEEAFDLLEDVFD